MVCYSHLFKSFTVCYDPHKDFSIVSKTEADDFMEFPCFLYDPTDVGNLISGSSAFSKSNLNIWKFLVHVMLKPTFENFCITLLVCEMSAIVQLNLHNIKQTILKGTIQK